MSLSDKMHEVIMQAINQAKLPSDFMHQVTQFYLPLAQQIHYKTQQQTSPLLLSLQGPQGAGKSTLCNFLQLILETEFGHRLAVLSLDDFYFDKTTRQVLANEIHPLLSTRGVPGTHDLSLAIETLSQLKSGKSVPLPRFNKAEDDPFPTATWPNAPANVSIILFEGWCNDVRPQSEDALIEPINELERNEDSDGLWRTYVNQQLARYNQELFSLSDALVCLNIPDFDCVYRWRGLQEEKLRDANQAASAVMNKAEMIRFIHHFERLSRHAMATLPERADMVLWMDDNHNLTNLTQQQG